MLLKLPNGSLLASNDYYKAKSPQNLTSLFRSDDDGKSWYYVTDLYPCFWGKLFYHKGSVYMLATANEYGDLLIGRSDDEGRNWSTPTVIFRGSNSCFESGFHKAPNNVVRAYGRLWTSIDYGSWVRKSFSNSIFSIDENADLLQAENWCCSGFLKHNPNWANAEDIPGAIEGNIVVAPDGSIVNMLRYSKNKANAKNRS
ncbi:MAG: exo-alpha-sialidase [Clostridiaceae bacterium]|nr:exo-alpha-sialidase [Clostridiaceae bacterium]